MVQWIEKHISMYNIIGMCKNSVVVASYLNSLFYHLKFTYLNKFSYLNTFNIEVAHRCSDNRGTTVITFIGIVFC